jgi:hypothetical protein
MPRANDDLVYSCLSSVARIDDQGMINGCETCQMYQMGNFLVGTLVPENKIYHYRYGSFCATYYMRKVGIWELHVHRRYYT